MVANPTREQEEAQKREQEAAQKRQQEQGQSQAKVGEDPNKPVDEKHSAVAPGTPAEATAPLTAENFENPEDAYKQNPPPAQVGPAAAKSPPSVHVAPGAGPPAYDARGYPVEPPKKDDETEQSSSKR